MGQASGNDGELVTRTVKGDVEAFAVLVERHQDYIFNAVVHLVGSRHDAEDVAQEVFLKAYRGLKGFRKDASFKTWLYGIMLNSVRSRWRTRGRRPKVLSLQQENRDGDPMPDPPGDAPGPLENAIRSDGVEILRRAIDQLETELKEVIVLRDIEGLSYEELAATLSVPMGTVKSRLFRARSALKDQVAPVLGEH